MIPPKTINFLRSPLRLKRFRDCPRLAALPYATYGNAHQITLAAEILGAALYWRADRFRSLKRSSTVKSKPIASVPVPKIPQTPPPPASSTPPQTLVEKTLVETPGEE